MKQKVQFGAFGIMLVILLAVTMRNLWGPAQPAAPIAASASELDDIVIGSLTIPDAELRVELLDSRRRPAARRPGRNIFSYGRARVLVETQSAVEEELPGETEEAAPPAAPGAPRAPFRLFGMAEGVEDGSWRVFLTDGTEIFSGEKGDTIKKRYRIAEVRKNSIELEDTREGHRWVIWLEDAQRN